jgi:hypothetical protein
MEAQGFVSKIEHGGKKSSTEESRFATRSHVIERTRAANRWWYFSNCRLSLLPELLRISLVRHFTAENSRYISRPDGSVHRSI